MAVRPGGERWEATNDAKGKGLLAKTDSLDAALLAEYAETYRPEARRLPDEEAREMAALLSRRRQLIEMMTAEKSRLEKAETPSPTLDFQDSC